MDPLFAADGTQASVALPNNNVTRAELIAALEGLKPRSGSAMAALEGLDVAGPMSMSSATNEAKAMVANTPTTIFVTDPQFGAKGDYTGTQNTAGTGTDARAAIQAALNYAYTQGPGGVNDTINGNSYTVKVPKGKYYISAPAAGMPSLVVPLKVEFDFSEAELHFDRPPLDTINTFGHGISEPNPLWCGIKVGNYAGLVIGKMQMKPDQDQTYGGAWYGMSLDGVRVQESDAAWIRGGGREHYILGFRGAAIRYLACINQVVCDLNLAGCCFGIVQSYFGTAYAGYTRYRGTTQAESVCTNIFMRGIVMINIYKRGVLSGVNGDYNTPAAGGFENATFDRLLNGGPISLVQCSFENIGESPISVWSTGILTLSHIRMERCGWFGSGSGVISAASVRGIVVENLSWQQEGGACLVASYTGPLVSTVVNPGTFVYVSATNVSPSLKDIYISNTANLSCKLVDGVDAVTRLPSVRNLRTEVANEMQGTTAGYMQNLIIENDGGRDWNMSTVGLEPLEAVNGARTVFNFKNGFTRMKPKRILVDGQILEATDVAGTNWTWTVGAGTDSTVTFTVAPAKKVRAFF